MWSARIVCTGRVYIGHGTDVTVFILTSPVRGTQPPSYRWENSADSVKSTEPRAEPRPPCLPDSTPHCAGMSGVTSPRQVQVIPPWSPPPLNTSIPTMPTLPQPTPHDQMSAHLRKPAFRPLTCNFQEPGSQVVQPSIYPDT